MNDTVELEQLVLRERHATHRMSPPSVTVRGDRDDWLAGPSGRPEADA